MLIHAAGESSNGRIPPHTFAIALTCKSERELDMLSQTLFVAGIQHKRIIEDDAPYCGELMALGIVPGERKKLKKFFSKLPLIK